MSRVADEIVNISESDVENISEGDVEIEIYHIGDSEPKMFKGHWNKGYGDLVRAYAVFIQTKVQEKYVFVIYTNDMAENHIVTIDFSKISYIKSNGKRGA